jgi:hypothetical protein
MSWGCMMLTKRDLWNLPPTDFGNEREALRITRERGWRLVSVDGDPSVYTFKRIET